MKKDLPTQVGIGFTICVAAATFLVAVVAGLFLIWQPDANTLTQQGNAARVSLADPAGIERGSEAGQSQAPLAGLDP